MNMPQDAGDDAGQPEVQRQESGMKRAESPSTQRKATNAPPGSVTYPYRAAIVGGGPAGIAVLIRAARLGYLKDLLRGDADSQTAGVVVLEKDGNSVLGTGRLGSYQIRSNTPANLFATNVVNDKQQTVPPESATGTPLERCRRTDRCRALEELGNEPAPLPLVGEFMHQIAVELCRQLAVSPESTYHTHCEVARIQRVGDKLWKIVTAHRSPGVPAELYARHVVLATGGSQPAPYLPSALHRAKLLTSDFALTQKGLLEFRQRLLKARSRKVVIVGGSHSAFSVAWTCLYRLNQPQEPMDQLSALLGGSGANRSSLALPGFFSNSNSNSNNNKSSGDSSTVSDSPAGAGASALPQLRHSSPSPLGASPLPAVEEKHHGGAHGAPRVLDPLVTPTPPRCSSPHQASTGTGVGTVSPGPASTGGRSRRTSPLGSFASPTRRPGTACGALAGRSPASSSPTRMQSSPQAAFGMNAAQQPHEQQRCATASGRVSRKRSRRESKQDQQSAGDGTAPDDGIILFDPNTINILHRGAVKVFYNSAREAEQDGYSAYTQVNQKGQVHAFGGLRTDAKALFNSIRKGLEPRVRLWSVKEGGSRSLIHRMYDDAAVIVWACGYTTNMIPVLDQQGQPIPIAIYRGQVDVNESGMLLRALNNNTASDAQTPTDTATSSSSEQDSTADELSSTPIDGLFGIGLGYGVKAVYPNGQPDGSSGRADGVAVYLKRAATVVLAGILTKEVYGGEGLETWDHRQEAVKKLWEPPTVSMQPTVDSQAAFVNRLSQHRTLGSSSRDRDKEKESESKDDVCGTQKQASSKGTPKQGAAPKSTGPPTYLLPTKSSQQPPAEPKPQRRVSHGATNRKSDNISSTPSPQRKRSGSSDTPTRSTVQEPSAQANDHANPLSSRTQTSQASSQAKPPKEASTADASPGSARAFGHPERSPTTQQRAPSSQSPAASSSTSESPSPSISSAAHCSSSPPSYHSSPDSSEGLSPLVIPDTCDSNSTQAGPATVDTAAAAAAATNTSSTTATTVTTISCEDCPRLSLPSPERPGPEEAGSAHWSKPAPLPLALSSPIVQPAQAADTPEVLMSRSLPLPSTQSQSGLATAANGAASPDKRQTGHRPTAVASLLEKAKHESMRGQEGEVPVATATAAAITTDSCGLNTSTKPTPSLLCQGPNPVECEREPKDTSRSNVSNSSSSGSTSCTDPDEFDGGGVIPAVTRIASGDTTTCATDKDAGRTPAVDAVAESGTECDVEQPSETNAKKHASGSTSIAKTTGMQGGTATRPSSRSSEESDRLEQSRVDSRDGAWIRMREFVSPLGRARRAARRAANAECIPVDGHTKNACIMTPGKQASSIYVAGSSYASNGSGSACITSPKSVPTRTLMGGRLVVMSPVQTGGHSLPTTANTTASREGVGLVHSPLQRGAASDQHGENHSHAAGLTPTSLSAPPPRTNDYTPKNQVPAPRRDTRLQMQKAPQGMYDHRTAHRSSTADNHASRRSNVKYYDGGGPRNPWGSLSERWARGRKATNGNVLFPIIGKVSSQAAAGSASQSNRQCAGAAAEQATGSAGQSASGRANTYVPSLSGTSSSSSSPPPPASQRPRSSGASLHGKHARQYKVSGDAPHQPLVSHSSASSPKHCRRNGAGATGGTPGGMWENISRVSPLRSVRTRGGI